LFAGTGTEDKGEVMGMQFRAAEKSGKGMTLIIFT
jgi:hypothetical protein